MYNRPAKRTGSVFPTRIFAKGVLDPKSRAAPMAKVTPVGKCGSRFKWSPLIFAIKKRSTGLDRVSYAHGRNFNATNPMAFVVLLAATVLWAGCTTATNSNNAGNANVAATPANTNAVKPNTNNANTNVHGNMNMNNMNMGNSDKEAKPKKTP
jgi:hypothetical protein